MRTKFEVAMQLVERLNASLRTSRRRLSRYRKAIESYKDTAMHAQTDARQLRIQLEETQKSHRDLFKAHADTLATVAEQEKEIEALKACGKECVGEVDYLQSFELNRESRRHLQLAMCGRSFDNASQPGGMTFPGIWLWVLEMEDQLSHIVKAACDSGWQPPTTDESQKLWAYVMNSLARTQSLLVRIARTELRERLFVGGSQLTDAEWVEAMERELSAIVTSARANGWVTPTLHRTSDSYGWNGLSLGTFMQTGGGWGKPTAHVVHMPPYETLHRIGGETREDLQKRVCGTTMPSNVWVGTMERMLSVIASEAVSRGWKPPSYVEAIEADAKPQMTGGRDLDAYVCEWGSGRFDSPVPWNEKRKAIMIEVIGHPMGESSWVLYMEAQLDIISKAAIGAGWRPPVHMDSEDRRLLLADYVSSCIKREAMKAVFCTHCGRIYVVDNHHGRDKCLCGAEVYPSAKLVQLGEELRLGEDFKACALGLDSARISAEGGDEASRQLQARINKTKFNGEATSQVLQERVEKTPDAFNPNPDETECLHLVASPERVRLQTLVYGKRMDALGWVIELETQMEGIAKAASDAGWHPGLEVQGASGTSLAHYVVWHLKSFGGK